MACICVAAPAPAIVDERQVASFIFRSTYLLTDDETIGVGLAELEAELLRILSLRTRKLTIEVLLFKSEEEYQSVVRSRHPKISERRACFIQEADRATIYAYKHSALSVDLRHECTHALVHADLPKIPLWLDEGLAEYFELPKSERAIGASHLKKLMTDLDTDRVIDLRELEKETEFESFRGREYRFAWAWVHFLLHGPEEASQTLWKYLGELRLGKEPLQFSQFLGKACPQYQDQFIAHFRNWPDVVQKSKTE